jgi:hypothetical protein
MRKVGKTPPYPISLFLPLWQEKEFPLSGTGARVDDTPSAVDTILAEDKKGRITAARCLRQYS